ncbi:Diaminopimelate decarboxylase [Corynebacterium ciconiae DSM 44920]|uniref:diaminopimelate decarboxylase n=1 Tax=Corynebacterium ciconiae TaxID=227319 RepID=UPI0003658DAD|nr:diaminopimelate decarboxylase [Corynebacterium ciconiae]WKD60965.1 Diaminopimelate decarboxylase [Corynebacterium ciconiae DSM 44920]
MNDFNSIPSHVWPRNAVRQDDGVVTIAGVPLPEIADTYGTPCYVIDEDDFRSRCRDMAEAFGGGENVHYASKALLTATVARWVDEEGLCMDVASLGELQIALAAGFPAERITAHGNNKSVAFLRAIISEKVGSVVLDNAGELELLDELSAASEHIQDVLIRVKPGIEAHTHEFIATAHEDQKFGFSLASGSAMEAARAAARAENLRLVGLHCHVGSQVFDAEGFSVAAERVLGLFRQLHDELPADELAQLSVLDLGGGYGIAYTEDEEPLNVRAVAADVIGRVAEVADQLGIPAPSVKVEPGRAIAGPAAVTLYEVGSVKDVHVDEDTTRRYVAVDGGMSDNIRPALYGAAYDGRLVSRFAEGEYTTTRIVGAHCESGDILIPEASYPNDLGRGDLFAIAATGAYCYVMSSRYNAFLRPPIVSVRGGQAKLMVRRETVEDILALENTGEH